MAKRSNLTSEENENIINKLIEAGYSHEILLESMVQFLPSDKIGEFLEDFISENDLADLFEECETMED